MTSQLHTLEEVIRDAQESWLIDSFGQPQDAIRHLEDLLASADRRARERLGDEAPSITAASVVSEYQRNPHKIKGYLQALGSTQSPEMLVMVWLILDGHEIGSIRMEYRLQHSFSLQVSLITPFDDSVEVYESTDIDDAALLRHLGIMKMDDKPVFDGFYALNLGV